MSPPVPLTRAIMTSPVATIARTAGALEAADMMVARRLRHLVVIDPRGHVVGIVSDRDLRSAQPSVLLVKDEGMRRKALALLRVEDVMTRHPASVRDDQPVDEVLEEMVRLRVGCLPVVDARGALVGIVTGHDVAMLALDLVRDRGVGHPHPSR